MDCPKRSFVNLRCREILRYVQDKIKTYFVDEVLFGELSKGGTAIIDVVDGEIKISKKTQR